MNVLSFADEIKHGEVVRHKARRARCAAIDEALSDRQSAISACCSAHLHGAQKRPLA
jgi:hypothetical protein